MPFAPFRLVMPRGSRAPLIAHVPHASTVVPPRVRRESIVLSDSDLQRELVRLTDWHTDRLFSWVLDTGGCMFINTLSRVVFDPERFVDDTDEPMATFGQGVVYTRTTDGARLATISDEERERRIRELYEPYHEGLTTLVSSTVEHFGMALLLDCHSFASIPLPSEPDQDTHQPDICIGTDLFHTPPALTEVLVNAFGKEGLRVQIDRPFAGTFVPLQFLGKDDRVSSVMIEVRRGLYCDEATGERSTYFDATRDAVRRAVTAGLAAALPTERWSGFTFGG
ncbi:MAG: N-formylglutamate amidohydrolase [Actinobacteria bacterium]|nr:N-formylglutamate amidohydrolase [Actinomycetota bacterium]